MFKKLVTDVFFDLDHTLWDFEKNSALTFEKIFLENKIDVDIADFLNVYVPINFRFWKLYREEKIQKPELRYQRLKSTFDRIQHPVSDEIINKLASEYIANLSTFKHLLPHTTEVLEYLKPNYKLHIITNGFQEIQEKKLRNSNIIEYFEHIVNSEMAGVKKPNPIIFELALQKANISAGCALMIGDNMEADILGAQALGFHTIHFNANNEPFHDYCPMITKLSEIKRYL